MVVMFSDKEKPVNTYCPDDIKKRTTEAKMQVTWDPPRYTDNCGDYGECLVTQKSNIAGNMFDTGASYPVTYTARDPSGNINTDCAFTVFVKGGCFFMFK